MNWKSQSPKFLVSATHVRGQPALSLSISLPVTYLAFSEFVVRIKNEWNVE